jgi:hypothetical protein
VDFDENSQCSAQQQLAIPTRDRIPQVAAGAGAYSVPIESERRFLSPYFILTQFLYANRFPLRWKTL